MKENVQNLRDYTKITINWLNSGLQKTVCQYCCNWLQICANSAKLKMMVNINSNIDFLCLLCK